MLPGAVLFGLLPALILLALAIVARARAAQRVPSGGPRFAPADGATVMFDALLVDADRRAVAASLIDLAVRRKIRMLTDAGEPGSRARRAPVGVELVEGASFTPDELTLLEALFGPDHAPGRVRRFSADGRALRRRLRDLLGATEARLAAAGLIRPGRRTAPVVLLRLASWILMIVDVVLFGAALAADGGAGDGAAFAVSFGAFFVALAALLVTPSPWRRFLPPSQPLRAHLTGLREYIALAEAGPLRFLQSNEGAELRDDVSADAGEARLQRYLLNERLLPYAVLFGLERSWIRVLKTESADLTALEGVEGVLEVTAAILQVIEIAGGVVQLVGAVGDLTDAAGGVIEVVGGVFDAVSS